MSTSLKQQNSSPWLMHEEWTLWPSKTSDYSKKLQRLARTSSRDVAGQWFANPRSCPQPSETSGFTCQSLVCRSMKWLQSWKRCHIFRVPLLLSEVFPPSGHVDLWSCWTYLTDHGICLSLHLENSVPRVFFNSDFTEDFSRIFWIIWYGYYWVLETMS